MHFIDGKCHIKQQKAGESHKTCLTKHMVYITPYHTLIINALGGGHTETQTHTET